MKAVRRGSPQGPRLEHLPDFVVLPYPLADLDADFLSRPRDRHFRVPELDNEPIENKVEFKSALRARNPGDTVAITLQSQDVIRVTLTTWRDILNLRFKEFSVGGAPHLGEATFCGMELADVQLPTELLYPGKRGVLIVETNPESESALRPLAPPYRAHAGDVIWLVGGRLVENIVDLVIALLGASTESADVRISWLTGSGITTGRYVTGTSPFRLPSKCVDDLWRIHARLSSKENGTDRAE